MEAFAVEATHEEAARRQEMEEDEFWMCVLQQQRLEQLRAELATAVRAAGSQPSPGHR